MIDQNLQDLGEVHLCVEVYVVYKGKVLMHRRSGHKKNFPGYLIGPGGHINDGEDVPGAACREVEEETGIVITAESLKLRYVGIHHHTDTHTVWVNWGFLAKPDKYEGQLMSSDEGTSEWIAFDELMRQKNDIFPPSLEYLGHLLASDPGVLYTSSEWSNNQLTRTLSKTLIAA